MGRFLFLAFVVLDITVAILLTPGPGPFHESSFAQTITSVQCPCSIRLHRHVRMRTRASNMSLDVLVIRQNEWDKFGSSSSKGVTPLNYESGYSQLNASSSSVARSDAFFHHFAERTVYEQGEFVVTLRNLQASVVNSLDFVLSVRPLARQGSNCPIELGPDRPPTADKSTRMDFNRRTSQLQSRIVGGNFASPNLVPYMVVVYNPNGRYCSGVLISERWGMTAAHCDLNTSFVAGLGFTGARDIGRRVSISRVYSHPGYSTERRGRQNDIAVFELAAPAPASSKFMRVNMDPSAPRTGEFVRVAGYGVISYKSELYDEAPGRLRQADVPVTDSSLCKRAYRALGIISSTKQICAGYYGTGGCDACQGDSGGPLFQYNAAGEPVVVGLTSYGLGCAWPAYPGVYARVSGFHRWLKTIPATFDAVTSRSPVAVSPSASAPDLSAPPSSTPSAAPSSRPSLSGSPLPAAVEGQADASSPCSAGSRRRRGRCVECRRNAVSDGMGRCRRCTDGFMRDDQDGAKCACSGKFAVGRGVVKGKCMKCRPGSFSGEADESCWTCPPGSFSRWSGAAACLKCPEGTWSGDGAKRCRPCRGAGCGKENRGDLFGSPSE